MRGAKLERKLPRKRAKSAAEALEYFLCVLTVVRAITPSTTQKVYGFALIAANHMIPISPSQSG